jgi:hypothetical protein
VRKPWASIFAGLAFTYALAITAILLAVTGLFEEEGNRRTLLVWIAMPVILTFGSWMAIQYGHPALRLVVWFSVVFIAFFVWIAVFSVGPYYLPALILLLIAGFAPWPGSIPERAEPPPSTTQTEAEILGASLVTTVIDGATKD